MHIIVRPAVTHTFLCFPRYQVTAKLETTPIEHDVIYRHRLDRLVEIFVDPGRAAFEDAAAAARHDACAAGVLPVLSPLKAGAKCLADYRALSATIAAARSFRIRLGDLMAPGGCTTIHRNFFEMRMVERVLVASIDEIAETVEAAARYSSAASDYITPRTAGDPPPRPSLWIRGRHGA